MREIPLRGEKSAGRVAFVDDEDYEFVNRHRWCFNSARHTSGTGYAQTNMWRNGKPSTIYMHVLLTGFPETDHKNGNGLDNQRDNLRRATRSGNSANSRTFGVSKYRGVSWHRGSGCWHARVGKNGKLRFLGSYDIEEDAARAYDEAAKDVHGEFARLNFPSKMVTQ